MLDLKNYSALGIGELLSKNEISPVDLVKDLCKKEDSLNAYITVNKDSALDQAKEVQARLENGERRSPLAGVPVAVKDNICTKGILTTCGSKMLSDFIPPYDATVVKKLKAVDMIILGKTNMDEFAMGSTGESSFFGAALNPYDNSSAAGGSSSGSSSAVAGGEAVIALGSDTGGSIRMPAAYCGAVGLKPTYGAVSRYGLIAYASSLDTIGVIGKNTLDAAALFGIIKGKDEKDSTSVDSPEIDLDAVKSYSLKGKSVGVIEAENPAVKAAVKSLEAMGAEVREIELSALKYALPAYYIIACAEASSNLARYDSIRFGYKSEGADNLNELFVNSRSEGFGFEVKKRIMVGTFVLSAGFYDEYYLKALKVKKLICSEFETLFKNCDFILSPVTKGEAPKLNQRYETQAEKYNADIYNICANLAGLPALSIPIIKNKMPLAVQLIGKAFSEAELLGAGYKLENYGI